MAKTRWGWIALGVASAVAYVAITYKELQRASEPSRHCDRVEGGDDEKTRSSSSLCVGPLISSRDRVFLELWFLDREVAAGSLSRPQWKIATGCSSSFTQPKDTDGNVNVYVEDGDDDDDDDDPFLLDLSRGTKLVLDRNRGNCTLSLPDYSRWRDIVQKGDSRKRTLTASPLKAKFVLRRHDKHTNAIANANTNTNTNAAATIITETPIFDLTRIVERKSSSSSSSTFTSSTEYVPHYKYARQPISLRLVLDEQSYGYPPYRGDGISIPIATTITNPNRQRSYAHRPLFYVDDTALLYSSHNEMAPPSPPPAKKTLTAAATTTLNQTYPHPHPHRPPASITIHLTILTPFRDVLQRQLIQGMNILSTHVLTHPEEMDEIRYFISDERLRRFFFAQLVSLLHAYLDYVTFRDEVRFYAKRKSGDTAGISVSSVIGKFFCRLVLLLYLLDVGTVAKLVLVGVAAEVFVEGFKCWKLLCPLVLCRTWIYNRTHTDKQTSTQIATPTPTPTLATSDNLPQLERLTQKHDRTAGTYLAILIYPLILGTALYSHQYYSTNTTSRYSWLVSTLADTAYALGFLSMCPQLYVNYKLRSVAHLPPKMFVYKLFSTFVDDAFAVLVEMPMKHRIMTLRDDVVFLGFLVQAYLYRVDPHRTNEFGYNYGGDNHDGIDDGNDKNECHDDDEVNRNDHNDSHDEKNGNDCHDGKHKND